MLEGLRMAQEQQTDSPSVGQGRGAGAALLLTPLPLLFHPATTPPSPPPRHVFSIWPSLLDGSRELWASQGKAPWRSAVLAAGPP